VATRQSIEAAVQLARERTLIVHMEQASEALRELRQADVSEHQGAAVSCLRAMIVALNERPQRELAELSRMLQDLVGRLARIVEAHEALMERTREGQAHPPSVEIVVSLADRQLSLAKTTIALYGELTLDEPLARRAAEELASADQLMRKAEGLLRKRALVDAMPAQIEAHAGLKEALALLQRLDESAQQRLADHSLDVLLNGLRELKGRQLAIRGETGQVGKKMHGKSRVSKADGLAFNQLAAQQKELIPLLEELRKKMDMSIVYAHVCRRIGVHMTEAAAGLTHRDAVTALIKQDEVLRQLSRLIESAEIKPPSKNREFVENQSGGGSGASSPTISKPIPTLAELKILRALQGDLSDQTVEVNRRLPEPIMRTEGQLKEVESLGVAQRELRELAVKMLEKAADGGGRR
jgi:hypothetical protein